MKDPSDAPPPGPFSFAEVVGNTTAIAWLRRSLERDSLPHGLLVVGPRGVGKGTIVRALAGEFFCTAERACGECPECVALREGAQIGFHVVEREAGKRVVSIAQIKELSSVLSLRAPHPKGRLVLIRDAERMTPSAQDAFLKTLEEPPPNNWLVLTVNRLDSILPTIRSRCQKLTLHGLAEDEVRQVGLGLGLAEETPWFLALGCPGRLAMLADPSLRDLRQGVVWILKQAEPGLSHWAYVLTRGLPAKPESAVLTERGVLLLQILHLFLRDLVALSVSPETTKIINRDFCDELRELRAQPRFENPADLLNRVAMARRWLEGSIDPVAALTALLAPTQTPLRHLAEVLEAEQSGL